MKVDITQEEFDVLCKRWRQSPTGIEEKVSTTSAKDEKFNFIKDCGTNICYFLFLEELERGMRRDSANQADDISTSDNNEPETQGNLMHEINVEQEEYEKLMMKIKVKVFL